MNCLVVTTVLVIVIVDSFIARQQPMDFNDTNCIKNAAQLLELGN
jgi:hypothetical protein